MHFRQALAPPQSQISRAQAIQERECLDQYRYRGEQPSPGFLQHGPVGTRALVVGILNFGQGDPGARVDEDLLPGADHGSSKASSCSLDVPLRSPFEIAMGPAGLSANQTLRT